MQQHSIYQNCDLSYSMVTNIKINIQTKINNNIIDRTILEVTM